MQNSKTKVAFAGTQEQEDELRAYINTVRNERGATLPVMQKAQEIYNYLPYEVQSMIAEELQVPISEVYGIASFYSQFTLNPKGRTEINVCLGTACYVMSSNGVLEKICETIGCKSGSLTEDGEYSIDATRCVGACGLAPVVIINDEVYGKVENDKEKIMQILEKYMKK